MLLQVRRSQEQVKLARLNERKRRKRRYQLLILTPYFCNLHEFFSRNHYKHKGFLEWFIALPDNYWVSLIFCGHIADTIIRCNFFNLSVGGQGGHKKARDCYRCCSIYCNQQRATFSAKRSNDLSSKENLNWLVAGRNSGGKSFQMDTFKQHEMIKNLKLRHKHCSI